MPGISSACRVVVVQAPEWLAPRWRAAAWPAPQQHQMHACHNQFQCRQQQAAPTCATAYLSCGNCLESERKWGNIWWQWWHHDDPKLTSTCSRWQIPVAQVTTGGCATHHARCREITPENRESHHQLRKGCGSRAHRVAARALQVLPQLLVCPQARDVRQDLSDVGLAWRLQWDGRGGEQGVPVKWRQQHESRQRRRRRRQSRSVPARRLAAVGRSA